MPDTIFMTIVVIAAAMLLAFIVYGFIKDLTPTTIYDFQKGLLYRHGKFIRVLSAGRHWTLLPGTNIILKDMRATSITVSGQEMLTADNLTIKASAILSYQIADPQAVEEKYSDHDGELYSQIQLALRHAVSVKTLDEILADKRQIDPEIRSALNAQADELGVEVLDATVRDLMLTADTKRAFADLFKARKEGEATLERARGETAALRSLANAARTLKNNPALFNLRLLQLISDPTAKGATVVLNTSGEPVAAPVQTDETES